MSPRSTPLDLPVAPSSVLQELMLPGLQAPAPLAALGLVTHVGTFDPADKGRGGESYEGTGLSVSVHPEDWEAIARLGGCPWWEADLSDRRLLDGNAALANRESAWAAWGQGAGLVVPCTVFVVSWWDSEWEERLETNFGAREPAEAEQEWMNAEDEQAQARLEERPGWAPTAALLEAMGHAPSRAGEPSPALMQAVATVWAQRAGLDGVWWEDTYAPERLSAPRGVIFPERVAAMGFVQTRAVPADLRPKPSLRRR